MLWQRLPRQLQPVHRAREAVLTLGGMQAGVEHAAAARAHLQHSAVPCAAVQGAARDAAAADRPAGGRAAGQLQDHDDAPAGAERCPPACRHALASGWAAAQGCATCATAASEPPRCGRASLMAAAPAGSCWQLLAQQQHVPGACRLASPHAESAMTPGVCPGTARVWPMPPEAACLRSRSLAGSARPELSLPPSQAALPSAVPRGEAAAVRAEASSCVWGACRRGRAWAVWGEGRSWGASQRRGRWPSQQPEGQESSCPAPAVPAAPAAGTVLLFRLCIRPLLRVYVDDAAAPVQHARALPVSA